MKRLLFLLTMCSPLAANAQSDPCGPADIILPNLHIIYGEELKWEGKTFGRANVLLFMNDETKTWTLIQLEGSEACVMTAGQGEAKDINL